jgi:hypothetical protein
MRGEDTRIRDATSPLIVPGGGGILEPGAAAPPTRAAPTAVDRIAGPFGRGAAEVWLVIPTARARSIVVFGHGWKLTPPSPGHPWVDQFRPWLDHLAAGGSAVIFPAYQLTGGDAQDVARVQDFAAAIRTGYAKLRRPALPFVACGYSFGASLSFYYAAEATAWGLPTPRAVQAIFPAGMIAGAPLTRLGQSVRVLIQVGAADTEAGSAGANEFWAWLASHPAARKRYEVIRSSPQLAATHAAPKATNAAARRAFWAPLDGLIAAARRSG